MTLSLTLDNAIKYCSRDPEVDPEVKLIACTYQHANRAARIVCAEHEVLHRGEVTGASASARLCVYRGEGAARQDGVGVDSLRMQPHAISLVGIQVSLTTHT